MPLYEYKCEKCGDVFEVIQKFVDEPVTTHDKCGGKVERLVSAPSLQFKGSGFYINDYGKGGSGRPAENGSPKSDSGSQKSSSSSESGANSAPASTSSGESKSSSSDSKAAAPSSNPKSSSSDSK